MEKPVCRSDVLRALEWRASVSHAEAKGECLVLHVPLRLNGSLRVGARERITLEIEKMGERFKKNGATRAWLDDCSDELVRGVVCEVNGPLFDWVVNRLGSSHFTAHELFCRGSPLIGCIAASGGGQPIDATSMGDVWSLWNNRERDNLELIDSLKDDDLENELHDLALRDASLRRMSPPMPVCQEDIYAIASCILDLGLARVSSPMDQ